MFISTGGIVSGRELLPLNQELLCPSLSVRNCRDDKSSSSKCNGHGDNTSKLGILNCGGSPGASCSFGAIDS